MLAVFTIYTKHWCNRGTIEIFFLQFVAILPSRTISAFKQLTALYCGIRISVAHLPGIVPVRCSIPRTVIAVWSVGLCITLCSWVWRPLGVLCSPVLYVHVLKINKHVQFSINIWLFLDFLCLIETGAWSGQVLQNSSWSNQVVFPHFIFSMQKVSIIKYDSF